MTPWQEEKKKKKKTPRPISLKYWYKNPKQNIGNPNQEIYKKDNTSWSSGVYFGSAALV